MKRDIKRRSQSNLFKKKRLISTSKKTKKFKKLMRVLRSQPNR